MLPTIQIWNRTIAMYGLFIMIGVMLGVFIAAVRSKKYNISREDVLFASCYAGIGLIIGAKLLYIITILPELYDYRQQIFSDPSLLLPIITGGFVFYGGLIGAVIGYYLYCRQYKISFIDLLDLMTPSVPLLHGFGRLGCFFAGCCYGIPYKGPLHIVFHKSTAAPNDVPLLPIQLIESCFNFIICILLFLLMKRFHRHGQALGFYLIYYSLMRFILEYFRGDIVRGFLLGISTSQWISLLLLPIGFMLYNGIKLPGISSGKQKDG
ncbi:MAG: lgt [Herbinix sp.]|jgi:phosphatidylglycerol:prolipoprotein diacylglycerol transferase|nr:lgt [Herbinix sp.]